MKTEKSDRMNAFLIKYDKNNYILPFKIKL